MITILSIQKARELFKQFDKACYKAIEHNTDQNNKLANELGCILALYTPALLDTLEEIAKRSDVGLLFDGNDHLNEYTHEANEKLLTGALDHINKIARGIAEE